MQLKTKFQDEDFELGEVADVNIATMPDGRIKVQAEAEAGGYHTFFYDSLRAMYEDWKDAPEEPKEYWYIDYNGTVKCFQYLDYDWQEEMQAIGNYFETEEEAKKAVEKLKAWKRLKDKGFEFDGWKRDERFWGDYAIEAQDYISCDDKDLDICFGGEE